MIRLFFVYLTYLCILSASLFGLHFTIQYFVDTIDSILVPCQHATEFKVNKCDCFGTPFKGKYCSECACEVGTCANRDITTPFMSSTYGCKCPTGSLYFGQLCENCFAKEDGCKGECKEGYFGHKCQKMCHANMTFNDLFSSSLSEDKQKCKHLVETVGGTCNICSGHGTCHEGECVCDDGWYDSIYGVEKCSRTCGDCGHGECTLLNGVLGCKCEVGFSGDNCEIACPGALNNKICSGHGSCDGTTCTCMENYFGADCGITCPGNPLCSGHGECQLDRSCECNSGWEGPTCNCSLATCHYHGVCNEGKCECTNNFNPDTRCETCKEGWRGEMCNHYCVDETCNGHGVCVLKNPGLVTESIGCGCDDGFDPDKNCAECYDTFYPKYETVGDAVIGVDGLQRPCEVEINRVTCNQLGDGNILYGVQSNMCVCDNPNRDPATNCLDCKENWFGDCNVWCSDDLVTDFPDFCDSVRCLHASGHGKCDQDGIPVCDDGYTGEFCNRRCGSDCSGHGVCEQNPLQQLMDLTLATHGDDSYLYTCNCDEGYYGEQCEFRCPSPPFVDGTECNGIGECKTVQIQPGFDCTKDSDCGYYDDQLRLHFDQSALSASDQAFLKSQISLDFSPIMGPFCAKDGFPPERKIPNFQCVNDTDMSFNCSTLDASNCDSRVGCVWKDLCTGFDAEGYCYDYLYAQMPEMLRHSECNGVSVDSKEVCTKFKAAVNYFETTYADCNVNYASLEKSVTSEKAKDIVASIDSLSDPYDSLAYCWQRNDMKNPFSKKQQLWHGYGPRTRFIGNDADVTSLCAYYDSIGRGTPVATGKAYDCEGILRSTENDYVCTEVTKDSLGDDWKPYTVSCIGEEDKVYQNWTEAWMSIRHGCEIKVDPVLGPLQVPENQYSAVKAVCDVSVDRMPSNDACSNSPCPNTTTCSAISDTSVRCEGSFSSIPSDCSVIARNMLECSTSTPAAPPQNWFDICDKPETTTPEEIRVWFNTPDSNPKSLVISDDGEVSLAIYFSRSGIFINEVDELESCPVEDLQCHNVYEIDTWYLITILFDWEAEIATVTIGDTVLTATVHGKVVTIDHDSTFYYLQKSEDKRCTDLIYNIQYPHGWTGDIYRECKALSTAPSLGPHDWYEYCDELAQYEDRNCDTLLLSDTVLESLTPLFTSFDKAVCLNRYLNEQTPYVDDLRLKDEGICLLSELSLTEFCGTRDRIFDGDKLRPPDIQCDLSNWGDTNWDQWCAKVTENTHGGQCSAVLCDCFPDENMGIGGPACELYCDPHSDGSPCGEKTNAGLCSFTSKQIETIEAGLVYDKGITNLRGECRCFLSSANDVCEVDCDEEICPKSMYNVTYNDNVTYPMQQATCDKTTGACLCLPPYMRENTYEKEMWTGKTVTLSSLTSYPYALKIPMENCTSDQECYFGACDGVCGRSERTCDELGLQNNWTNPEINGGDSCMYDKANCEGNIIFSERTGAGFYEAQTLCADKCRETLECKCFSVQTSDMTCILKDGHHGTRRRLSVSGAIDDRWYKRELVSSDCTTESVAGTLSECKNMCSQDCKGFFFDGTCKLAYELCSLTSGTETFYEKFQTGFVYNLPQITKMNEGECSGESAAYSKTQCAKNAYDAGSTTFQYDFEYDLGYLVDFKETLGFEIKPGYASVSSLGQNTIYFENITEPSMLTFNADPSNLIVIAEIMHIDASKVDRRPKNIYKYMIEFHHDYTALGYIDTLSRIVYFYMDTTKTNSFPNSVKILIDNREGDTSVIENMALLQPTRDYEFVKEGHCSGFTESKPASDIEECAKACVGNPGFIIVPGSKCETSPVPINIVVTVAPHNGQNRYYFNGILYDSFTAYGSIRFDLTQVTAHPFRLSTTADGTHAQGSEYSTTRTDTELLVTIDETTPTLFFYCELHPNMGGSIFTECESEGSMPNDNFQCKCETNPSTCDMTGTSGWMRYDYIYNYGNKNDPYPSQWTCGDSVEPSGSTVATYQVDRCKCQLLCEENNCVSWFWDGTCHFKDGQELKPSKWFGGLGGKVIERCQHRCSGDFSIHTDVDIKQPDDGLFMKVYDYLYMVIIRNGERIDYDDDYASPNCEETDICYLEYCNNHADLKAAFCSGQECVAEHVQACKDHWNTYGRSEGRTPNADICVANKHTLSGAYKAIALRVDLNAATLQVGDPFIGMNVKEIKCNLIGLGYGDISTQLRGTMYEGQTLVSQNGDYVFTVGAVSSIVSGQSTQWSLPLEGTVSLTVEDNNDLVWRCDGVPCKQYSLGGAAGPNSRLVMENDGQLTFYDHKDAPLWKSGHILSMEELFQLGFSPTREYIIGPTAGQCYCSDYGMEYKVKHSCKTCEPETQAHISGTVTFNYSDIYAYDDGAFEVYGKKFVYHEPLDETMSYVLNGRQDMTFEACETSAHILNMAFGGSMQNPDLRRHCVIVGSIVYWNRAGYELSPAEESGNSYTKKNAICASVSGCLGDEPCNGENCYVYKRIGETCTFNRQCKTGVCDKNGIFGCQGRCVVAHAIEGATTNCPSPQNFNKRVYMMQGPESFMNYLNVSVKEYSAFLESPEQYMCGRIPCTRYDTVLLQHLAFSTYVFGHDCTQTCPGTNEVIPCNGNGRCSKTGECIGDPARILSLTDENNGFRNVMHVGDLQINMPNLDLSTLERTGIRGEASELICPGYDLDAKDMTTVCSGHGICNIHAECQCETGFSGENCQFRCPGFSNDDANECSGHGVCETVKLVDPDMESDLYYSVARTWIDWQEECHDLEGVDKIEIEFTGAIEDLEFIDINGDRIEPTKIFYN